MSPEQRAVYELESRNENALDIVTNAHAAAMRVATQYRDRSDAVQRAEGEMYTSLWSAMGRLVPADQMRILDALMEECDTEVDENGYQGSVDPEEYWNERSLRDTRRKSRYREGVMTAVDEAILREVLTRYTAYMKEREN